MDETPDLPLDNFGGATEVATPPVAEAEAPAEAEQTTQPTEGSGSESQAEDQESNDLQEEAKPDDNPKPEEGQSQRPEKRDRLQNRFGELTGKIKERDQYIEQLEAQMARAQAQSGIKPLQPDEEGQYSVEAINQYQAQVAQAAAQAEVSVLRQQMEREQVANRLDAEGAEIEKMLNEKGLAENPAHVDFIRSQIEERIALAQYNPQALKSISAKKIAENYIRGIESERRKAQSTTAQNVQTLKAEQAVTPNSPASNDGDEEAALTARLADIKF